MSRKRDRGRRRKKADHAKPSRGPRGGGESATLPDRGETLQRLLLAGDAGKREVWVWLAYACFISLGAMIFYLGLRPGGMVPVILYMEGRIALALVALTLLAFGCVKSLVKRPFLQGGRLRALIALAVVIGVSNYPFPYPSSHEGHPSSVTFRLPVEGEWVTFWGGESKDQNRLAAFLPDRRWGLHLVKEVGGLTHSGSGERASDYYAWDQAVLAPAAGEVVVVHDGEPEVQPGRLWQQGAPFGNLVVLRVAEGEFCFLAHLRAGSIPLEVGDRVSAGELVGRVGCSGQMTLTPEPHVAVHLQDTPVPQRGEPIPWVFHDYFADGQLVEAGMPRGGVGANGALLGQRVRPADEPPEGSPREGAANPR